MFAPLLKAVRDVNRIGLKPLNIDEDSILVMEDGRPAAECGQVFVSIFNVDMTPDELSGNAILSTLFGVGVGITVRLREVPVDRRGEFGYTDIGDERSISCAEIAARVIRSVHGRPEVMIKANQNAARFNMRYDEPLFLARSLGEPERKKADHFNIMESAQRTSSSTDDDDEALYLELLFQGARSFSHALEFIDPEV